MPLPPLQRAELRAMPNDKRAETIVEMFKVAAGEWAAMVLEHISVPPGVPPPEVGDNTIRELLRGLDLQQRCDFLGSLFEDICQEFAALVADAKETMQ